ncbi:ribosomal protein L4 [Linderina pennispora]|uniref:Large ribosomal subunit protein uL4m n=1 Tax=Linderina pennispora TaxID=61395 RepID=A0A1Y1WLB9_9FUNG|nr:ribosomal protein L4 [Linderina pennispora]ORX74155.1 ribosomal protein L4 [Linderina pennispora]
MNAGRFSRFVPSAARLARTLVTDASQTLQPSVLRPIGSLTRKIAPSAGTKSALNWPPPQPLKAINPLAPTVQAFVLDFATSAPQSIAELPRTVFAAPVRSDIIHRVVTYERNLRRQGTHNSRTRSEVRGSTRKITPQKGLGMARHGTRRAPQYVGGAKAHGPVPRSHAIEIQRKVWLMGLRAVISAKYAQDQLVVVEDFDVASHRTQDLRRTLVQNAWMPTAGDANVLMMPLMDKELPEGLRNLELASRNLPGVYEILRHDYLIIDRKALELLQSTLLPL